VPCMLS